MFNFFTKQDKDKVKSSKIATGLNAIFNSKKLDEEMLDKLEDLLLSSDISVSIVSDIIRFLKNNRFDKEVKLSDIKEIIYNKLASIFADLPSSNLFNFSEKPYVLVFFGVNGSGKTTLIGKLANKFKLDGKKTLVAACDTFRAGASDQLRVWTERSGVDIVLPEREFQDPASLAFQACEKARKENYDVLLIDTAGRLQSNTNLMNQLTKLDNILTKLDKGRHKNFLVLDATIGQNSNTQIEMFSGAVKIDEIIINKMDGTAKGGALVSITDKFKKPIACVGAGENIEDIYTFDYKNFLKSLLDL